VLTPGEPERAYKAKRLVEGVPVDGVTWAEIVAAGAKVGLPAGDIEALARRR
jgi:LDH2 family malate/lactate/ureidoglycolate dehydrogenase